MRRNKYTFVIAVCLVLVAGTLFAISGCSKGSKGDNMARGKVMYHCPMHPTYVSDKPGDCPICGMKLVKMETKSEDKIASGQGANAPKPAEEKSLKEVCIEHKCTMNNCAMNVKTHMKPGERMICPVCGEVISTTSGKVVEIAKALAGGLGTPSDITSSVAASTKKEHKILYYRNPMNPQATSPVPMKDSMGMDYIPVYEEESGLKAAGSTITINPEKQQLIGLKTEAVKRMNLTKIIRASGKIAYDPELVVTQEEFIQALKNKENVKDSPLQDVIERAKSMAEAARNKLKLLGMSDDQIAELENTKRAQTNLYLPGQGEGVWAYISIYEYEIGLVHPGDMVDIEAVAYPGEIFSGKMASINPVLDSATRTNQVRVEVANPDNKLKPEMFINAKIKVDLGEKLAVPESAVLDTGLRKIVYLLKGDSELESAEIVVGQKVEGYYEVLGGLGEGDLVVTSGNFLVDSESKLKSSGAR
jgi:Cu(I)/Ag(I) efflux system membrane fusion protein